MTFGERLARLGEATEMIQADYAALLRISRTMLSGYLNGHATNPRTTLVNRVAELEIVYGLSLGDRSLPEGKRMAALEQRVMALANQLDEIKRGSRSSRATPTKPEKRY